jgi:inner membrane protein
MDNLTHSLAGLALGELAERSLAPEPDPVLARVRRRVLLLTGWAASNFPDLDLLLTPLAPRPLGYLLHHRGHTHTLLYALPQALLLLALVWLLWPTARRLLRESRQARVATVVVAGLGLALHLAMDFLNVYGVHPFHPFDSRWLYGDMVFIVEPVFWVAFGAPLAAMSGRIARWVLLALLAGVPAWFTASGYLQWGSLAGLGLLGLALVALQLRCGERGRAALVASFAAALGFVGVQGVAVRQARELVAGQASQALPASRLLDVPLSAFPANPLCWSFITIERSDAAGTYVLRRGVLSLAPAVTPVSACPNPLGSAVDAPPTAALAWQWEQSGSLEALRSLRRTDCRIDAWMRFARAPSLQDGSATDVRFGPPGGTNFSTLPYAAQAGTPCPRYVPGWGYPRADLLGE